MKKILVGIVCLIMSFVFIACSSGNTTSESISTQTPTMTQVSATPSMSAAFAALLATKVPRTMPTFLNATPLLITGTPQPLVTSDPGFIDQENIKRVIQSYFDARHKSFNTLQLEGFDDLISNTPEAITFWNAESRKLQIELKHAKVYGGRYVAYEYFLDYQNISVDLAVEKAAISVSLRNNIIYEISALLASGEPIMSSMSGEDHTIVLQKEDGEWKIISDIYNDFPWRMIRKSGDPIDEVLLRLESQPLSVITPTCFTSDRFSTSAPEHTDTIDNTASSSPTIKAVYLNGKRYDPGWTYSFPFTNLYFELDGESTLRFIVELDNALAGQTDTGWQIVVHHHIEGEETANQQTLVLDNIQEISCDSRPALLFETSLEEIQKELGNHRVFDYQVVDEKGSIRLERSFYLNPYNSYFISDTFGEIDIFDGGIIGYPNLMDESKTIFPREGQAIVVREPRGGFFQLHYLVRIARLNLFSGIWTEETSDGVVIQFFQYRDHGLYVVENSYTIPDQRKIRGPKNYNFEFFFTVDELREFFRDENEFYLRFLDKNGNILGGDYLYFIPYSQSTP